mgnify:CR=1 FL=1
MKKLKTWQIVLLVIFYPVGICVWIYRAVRKSRLKKERIEAEQTRREAREREAAERRARVLAHEEAIRREMETRDVREYKIVGVTFANDEAPYRNRQVILRELDDDGAPASALSLGVYDYEGSPAVGLYYNGEQVGNISRSDLKEILPLMERYERIRFYEILGGDGMNYGIVITVYFCKE